jgi:DNA-binding LacI/PurR family transcriptional regulator
VNTVVRSLKYAPLRKRRAPARNLSLEGKRIGIILLGMDRPLSSLPVVAAATHGVEAALARGGASATFVDIPHIDSVPAVLRQESFDGVILKGALQGNLGRALDPPLVSRLSALPSVWFLRRPAGCWGDSVAPNDLLVGKMAAEYLLKQGHSRLAFVNAKPDHATFRLRGLSFKWHAEAAGAAVEAYLAKPAITIPFPRESTHSVAAIGSLIDELLASSPRPTALFTPCDGMAALVYRALAVRNIQIGKELSVISCNYEPALISSLHPDLTTLNVHAELIGRRAVEHLGSLLGRPRPDFALEIAIEPTLVEGNSVVQFRAR